MNTIDQFMWGYLPHFRRDLEINAGGLLESIGLTVGPMALLIGIEEKPGGHPICVEPERIGIDPGIFADCTAQGNAAYEAHDNRQMIMTHKGLSDQFHAELLDKCRASALAEALNSHVESTLRRWFVGKSARVGRYRVYPVLGLLRSRWDGLPAREFRDHDHRIEM